MFLCEIYRKGSYKNSTNFACFYLSTPAKLGSTRPNTDCLAASNGVCTKRNTAQFELLPFENEVNNNSQTWPLIHLTSLATFSSKILLLKWVMPVKWIWRWIWTKWQISVLGDIHIMFPFYLILTRGPKIIVKKNLKLKDAFLGVCSIRILAKNRGDPYYEPTIVVHDIRKSTRACGMSATYNLQVEWLYVCSSDCML